MTAAISESLDSVSGVAGGLFASVAAEAGGLAGEPAPAWAAARRGGLLMSNYGGCRAAFTLACD
jgi:hypothetical protein